MSRLAGVAFSVGAALCALLFADVAFTKLFAGQWLGYLVMSAYAIGAIACVLVARSSFRQSATQSR